jgi:hypothetical protein
MPLFLDDAVPALLGSNLLRFSPTYNARVAVDPPIKHDFSATRGKQVQLDRFKRWGERGMTKAARARNKNQLIGTARSEGLSKTTKFLTLTEFTGPSDIDGNPSTLHVTAEDMLYSRQMLWQYGLGAFHRSIGSANLSDDFQMWFDRSLILELMNCTIKYNPGAKADGATLNTDKFTTDDLYRIREILSTRNTPRFSDGTYHVLAAERMMTHLAQDNRFQQFALAAIQGGGPVPQSLLTTGEGMNTRPQIVGAAQTFAQTPIRYEGFTFFPSNNIPTRTVNALTGHLGLFFGPESVGVGSGSRGPVVKLHSDTDFDRHFHFIWQWYGELMYLLDDDDSSGACIEARTYAA